MTFRTVRIAAGLVAVVALVGGAQSAGAVTYLPPGGGIHAPGGGGIHISPRGPGKAPVATHGGTATGGGVHVPAPSTPSASHQAPGGPTGTNKVGSPLGGMRGTHKTNSTLPPPTSAPSGSGEPNRGTSSS